MAPHFRKDRAHTIKSAFAYGDETIATMEGTRASNSGKYQNGLIVLAARFLNFPPERHLVEVLKQLLPNATVGRAA